ncbi:MAG: zf-HC2 domain-containing protein [Dehalococcoidales bacterium]|nr:zf-HC2 domain-containing protein [Dehalococcoidales bacterium]
MNCKLIQELLSAYANDELDNEQRTLVETHLADCRECKTVLGEFITGGHKIRLLQETPSLPDIKPAVLAQISPPEQTGKPRKWLRPALVVVPVVASLVTVFSLLPIGSGLTPNEILARAQAVGLGNNNTKHLITTTESYDAAAGQWQVSNKMEDDVIIVNRRLRILHQNTSPSDNYEIIANGQGAYYRAIPEGSREDILFLDKYASLSSLLRKLQDSGADVPNFNMVDVSSIFYELNQSGFGIIAQLPDEAINNKDCFHFQAKFDPERIRKIDKMYNIITELWVEKSNFQLARKTQTIEKFVRQDNNTLVPQTRYFSVVSFLETQNEITLPLTSTGELLPGWHEYQEITVPVN